MRREITLKDGWTFYKEGAAQQISLPHTWNALDGQDGGDDYYRGTCCYEQTFDCPVISESEQVYLEFAGVNSTAQVMVNGQMAGTHEGGYSAFRFPITQLLQEKNTLKVLVDNSPNDRVYPQKADFTFYGGIYREVKLVIVPRTHFAMDCCGGPGVKVRPILQEGQALVQVKFWLEGMQALRDGDLVEIRIEDQEGTVVKTRISGKELQTARYEAELVIEHPHLWQGIKDPYLYTLTASLIGGGTQILDQISLRFGCRSFCVDPERGFLLNGEAYPLRGVSRHQDREGVGNALTRQMHREDMELIREVGANSIRLAHYQHDQYFYDLCDEYGMVVWAEIPYITCHMDSGRENTLSQMKELILQNHHHASICFWGISNEVTVAGVTESVLENNRALHQLCKELDPDRLTTMACAFMLEEDSPMTGITDVISYNHYFGWYHGEVQDNDAWFDHFHEKHPKTPAGLSEYGAEAVLKWQTAKPERGDYTEEYQALYHEHMLEMIGKRPWIWCTYVWNMFDFAADGRDEGGVKGRNNKGLVTFDRKVKKDAFYLYKAYWSKEPFVYIAGRRFVNRAQKLTEITVYSNQPRVELYQNGEWKEEKEGSHIFRFQVTMEPQNVILVTAGSLQDTVTLYSVEKPDPSYVLPVQGGVENWFNDLLALKEGYFSLEDKVGELVKSPEGLTLFREFMAVYDSRKKGAAAATHMTEEQRLMTMRTMKLSELMRRTNTPGEEVEQWYHRLQQIEKPD